MNKSFSLLLLLASFCSLSCKTNNKIEVQIESDLVGMLHGKVTVEEILIREIIKGADSQQQVYFDCQLYFKDDLYKDNGELAFKKGFRVKETGNKFLYTTNEQKLKLVGFEFGESIVID